MVERTLDEYVDSDQTEAKDDGEWEEGFCAICATNRAPHVCVKCGKRVCSEHFVHIMGLCVECAPVKNHKKNPEIPGQSENEGSNSYVTYKKIEKPITEEAKIDWV